MITDNRSYRKSVHFAMLSGAALAAALVAAADCKAGSGPSNPGSAPSLLVASQAPEQAMVSVDLDPSP